ncbi:Exocyst complex component [Musa troglodytarum]|uniref:Exocyst complex component n=1 Tax=Musa troglodytarum TaxID=320322 RepID=A0A9E7KNK9_9LILI|nr:Exocyst complex component [Musa troglodytarum]
MADEDVSGSHTDGSSITSSSDGDHEYPMVLKPMTAVGVKRLCSELLAIKKASDEDLNRNVYSCYSAFVRILEEVPRVKCDLEELKQNVLNQRMLVQDLINSLYLEKPSDNSTETKAQGIEDLDLHSDGELGSDLCDAFDTFDIFL